jgi:hypothetical protein
MLKLVVDIVTTGLLRVNNTVGSSGYIMLNSAVISKLYIEGDVKGNGNSII